MLGCSQLEQREFSQESLGYRATKHQAFVGTGYFDAVQTAISAGAHSTGAMAGSTEAEQFTAAVKPGPQRATAERMSGALLSAAPAAAQKPATAQDHSALRLVHY